MSVIYIHRLITTEVSNSHESISIELANPINETVEIALGQDDIEALQNRFKFRKILPGCLSNIHSKVFLQKGLSIGKIYLMFLVNNRTLLVLKMTNTSIPTPFRIFIQVNVTDRLAQKTNGTI